MALALNNLKRVDMPLNKETKPSNSKFRSFQVRILIQKDNTDNKVFKREFYTKETRKKGVEKIKDWITMTRKSTGHGYSIHNINSST